MFNCLRTMHVWCMQILDLVEGIIITYIIIFNMLATLSLWDEKSNKCMPP